MEPSEAAFDDAGRRQPDASQSGARRRVGGDVEISKTGVRVPGATELDPPSEATPLITERAGSGDDDGTIEAVSDFSHLPWYKRPSVYWILPPFFLTTLAFGGVLAPKLDLILEIICQEYINERMLADPSLVLAPVDFAGGDNAQCRSPEVSSRAAIFTLGINLISGIASALVAPHLGALSDRRGRRLVLMITVVGTICNELISIFAALYPDTVSKNVFLLGAALDGFTGSFTISIAMVNAYAADVIPPALRNVVFARFQAALFTGLALGPILAGLVVKLTGQIVAVFIMLAVVHAIFGAFVLLFVPESLSEKRQQPARDRLKKEREFRSIQSWLEIFKGINPFLPLKIFWPTGEGTNLRLRINLVLLASVDTIAFGVAMGTINVILLYGNQIFGWTTFIKSAFMTIVSGSRVLTLALVLPLLIRFFKKTPKNARLTGSDNFDLNIIRLAMGFDTLGYVGYVLAASTEAMLAAGAFAAIGGIGSPTLQAAITKHVPWDRTGEILGAIGFLHALARVVAPTVFSVIYAETTGTYPAAVFVCLVATFGVAFVISWFVKPHGM